MKLRAYSQYPIIRAILLGVLIALVLVFGAETFRFVYQAY